MKQKINTSIALGTSVIFALMVGYCASLATRDGVIHWYPTLHKPFFTPPSWLFAPVWTLLYILMGIAAGRVWNRRTHDLAKTRVAMRWYVAQLAANGLWSFLFFYWHNPLLALIEILLMATLIEETRRHFAPLDATAAKLLWPYLAWVAFATCLNAGVWWLN